MNNFTQFLSKPASYSSDYVTMPGVVVHTSNPSPQETVAGKALYVHRVNSRPAKATHSKSVPNKQDTVTSISHKTYFALLVTDIQSI